MNFFPKLIDLSDIYIPYCDPGDFVTLETQYHLNRGEYVVHNSRIFKVILASHLHTLTSFECHAFLQFVGKVRLKNV